MKDINMYKSKNNNYEKMDIRNYEKMDIRTLKSNNNYEKMDIRTLKSNMEIRAKSMYETQGFKILTTEHEGSFSDIIKKHRQPGRTLRFVPEKNLKGKIIPELFSVYVKN